MRQRTNRERAVSGAGRRGQRSTGVCDVLHRLSPSLGLDIGMATGGGDAVLAINAAACGGGEPACRSRDHGGPTAAVTGAGRVSPSIPSPVPSTPRLSASGDADGDVCGDVSIAAGAGAAATTSG